MRHAPHGLILLAYIILVIASLSHSVVLHSSGYLILVVSHLVMLLMDLKQDKDS